MENTKRVGENALQKLVRLLRKTTDESVTDGTKLIVNLEPTGAGRILHLDHEGECTVIFNFKDVEGLMDFLEASPVERMRLARRSAR